ncbi:MAG TPA: hypothetical protein VMF05_02560 [Stellaceae bacterium]|nr:hypothetical protein [Stellaceae bacterium]
MRFRGRGRGRAFALAAVVAALPWARASACTLADASSTRWSLATDRGVAWLVTPCGRRFFSLGVNAVDGGYPFRRKDGKVWYSWTAFDRTRAQWVATARRRLAKWGFNSAGGWSLPPQVLRLPTIIDLELGRQARFHWFDPFSPETAARMMALARKLVAPYRNSPYRIGYFSDNEVGWWAGALFVFYSMKPASSVTKQRWIAALHDHYAGDWTRFTADFQPPRGVRSWRQLLATTGMTRLRPGGSGIRAVREWTGIVARHYYALAARAIHAADPQALYFGDRLPIYYDPAAVRAEAPYVDAIATNYNVDSSDGWIAPYYFNGLEKLSGGKPVLVSEWFFAARHNRTGNRNNGHLMTVDTQAERAAGAAAAIENFAAIPEIIGAHWFQYYDHPKGGRQDGEDYDFGLVDINDQPYRRLTEALAVANRRAFAIHEEATPPGLDAPDTATPDTATPGIVTVPRADVALSARSLADWPKPRSLLPALRPSPGAVDFGEVYLTWSARGLQLATIGQDYYDIDLLAYHGAFPLGEAYRVEFGVDIGQGPRRFTLFFIPPRTKLHDYPEMRAELCAGAAEQAIRNGCTAVAGGQAVYFGADQPRITAEVRIPWAALGIAAPAAGTSLRVAIAITSWDRDRWMSLSGRPPAAALRDPGKWRPMRLGGGVPAIGTGPRLAAAPGRP